MFLWRLHFAQIAFVAGFLVPAGAEERTWHSVDGKNLVASLVTVEDESIVLRLPSGREVSVPLTRLSKEDRGFVDRNLAKGLAYEIESMPEVTAASRQIEVEGGPRIFVTPHFEFETDQDVLPGFIAEAARVYEGTYEALNALPFGLAFEPPRGRKRFRGRFLGDAAFDSITREVMPSLPGQRVVGLYLGSEQELLVPYSSLGAVRRGDRLSLRKSSDTTTLIHEIVHQVMHEWLPVMPTWFSEGIAEYLAAVPYQNGQFEFKNAERGLKERLLSQHGIADGTISGVRKPSLYFERYRFSGDSGAVAKLDAIGDAAEMAESEFDPEHSPEEWTGSVAGYRDALLTVYYFMHLHEARNPGAPVGAYLRMVDVALRDTENIKEALATFEEERLAYNADVTRFNQELDEFRRQVDAYNHRVTVYNQQVRDGVPEGERIVVGDTPREPISPRQLTVPNEIERASNGGMIDLSAMVKKASLPGLLRGAASEDLDRSMRDSFAAIGIQIQYR